MSYSGNTGSAAVKRCARVYPGLGEQKKDFTAVLLGGAEAVEVFDRVAECLRRQGVDVVAVQLPGFGKTADELPKLSAAEVIEGIALEIAAACRSKRVVLLGHSMGALLGVTLLGGERLKQEVEISGFLQLAPAYVLRDWAAGLLCRLVIAGVSLMPRRVLNALKLFAPVCGPLIKGGLALRFLRMKIPWRGPYERRCLDAAFMEEPRDAGVAEVFTEFLPLSAGTYYFSFLYRALRVLQAQEIVSLIVDPEKDAMVMRAPEWVRRRCAGPPPLVMGDAGHLCPRYKAEEVCRVLLELAAG